MKKKIFVISLTTVVVFILAVFLPFMAGVHAHNTITAKHNKHHQYHMKFKKMYSISGDSVSLAEANGNILFPGSNGDTYKKIFVTEIFHPPC